MLILRASFVAYRGYGLFWPYFATIFAFLRREHYVARTLYCHILFLLLVIFQGEAMSKILTNDKFTTKSYPYAILIHYFVDFLENHSKV